MKRRSPAALVAVLIALVGFALNSPLSGRRCRASFLGPGASIRPIGVRPGPPPKSMTITYSAANCGMKIVVDMVPAEGPRSTGK